MNLRRCVVLAFALGLFVALASPRAHAQAPARVGEAAVVQNEVLRVAGSGASQINVGDGLLRDEVVRTGADSAARLVMIDSTNLSLGANASIRLDRTVFNDEHSYKEIAIRLTTGAFRFVTGHSEKTAYKITTPLATIGVRGTTLDILSQNGKSIVVLQEGAAMVCTLSFQCIQLTQPGDTAIITVDRRQDHDHEDVELRPGRSRRTAPPRRGFAPSPPLPMPRRSMNRTACCADADHGEASSAISSCRPRSARRCR